MLQLIKDKIMLKKSIRKSALPQYIQATQNRSSSQLHSIPPPLQQFKSLSLKSQWLKFIF